MPKPYEHQLLNSALVGVQIDASNIQAGPPRASSERRGRRDNRSLDPAHETDAPTTAGKSTAATIASRRKHAFASLLSPYVALSLTVALPARSTVILGRG